MDACLVGKAPLVRAGLLVVVLTLGGCFGAGGGGNDGDGDGDGDPRSSGGASGAGSGGSSSSNGGSAATLPGKGVGQPCETSSDCEQGLSCNSDPIDYIAHQQCTAFCTSEEACTGPFGEDTMCIGAELCTLECRTDADCPDLTLCNDFGWCARSGAGSGVPYCTGSPTPCSLLAGSQCSLTLGCSDDSECGGVASSCYSQYSSYACNALDGCFWSSSSESCTGSASSCFSQFSEYSCGAQDGCYWSGGCSGTPYTCEELSPSLCDSQPGCVLMN